MLNQQRYTYQPASIKKLSYSFSLDSINFVKGLPEDKITLPIGEQILKSSTSVGANIVEANASSSIKESAKYFEIALKSSRKAEYWLRLLGDSYPKNALKAEVLISQAQNLRAMLELIIESMEANNNDHTKQ